MTDFRFHLPIDIRYSDLDPQWHVNHARLVSYLEQARFRYVMDLGLFDGRSFLDFEFIIADLHISYLAPVHAGQPVQVAMSVTRLGNKSLGSSTALKTDRPSRYLPRLRPNGDFMTTGRTTRPIFIRLREKIAALKAFLLAQLPKPEKGDPCRFPPLMKNICLITETIGEHSSPTGSRRRCGLCGIRVDRFS